MGRCHAVLSWWGRVWWGRVRAAVHVVKNYKNRRCRQKKKLILRGDFRTTVLVTSAYVSLRQHASAYVSIRQTCSIVCVFVCVYIYVHAHI